MKNAFRRLRSKKEKKVDSRKKPSDWQKSRRWKNLRNWRQQEVHRVEVRAMVKTIAKQLDSRLDLLLIGKKQDATSAGKKGFTILDWDKQ